MKIRCVVSCVNASGEPDFCGVTVTCTEAEYTNGDHYDRARQLACAQRYESPAIVYDERDGPTWLFKNVFKG